MCSLVSCGSEIGVQSSVYVLYSSVLHPFDLFLASHMVLGFILAFSCRLFSLSSIFFCFSLFYFRAEFPLTFHVGFFGSDLLFRGSCVAVFF